MEKNPRRPNYQQNQNKKPVYESAETLGATFTDEPTEVSDEGVGSDGTEEEETEEDHWSRANTHPM